MMILHHSSNIQVLNTHDAIVPSEHGCGFVNRVSSHIRYSGVQSGNALFSFLATCAALNFTTQRLLSLPQGFQFCAEGARVGDNMPIREGGEVFHAEINADRATLRHLVGNWLAFYSQTRIPTASPARHAYADETSTSHTLMHILHAMHTTNAGQLQPIGVTSRWGGEPSGIRETHSSVLGLELREADPLAITLTFTRLRPVRETLSQITKRPAVGFLAVLAPPHNACIAVNRESVFV